MPRAEDIAWKFVIRLEGKKWRCPYCHKVSSGSVTRVKSHFLKQPKEGIASCTKVPEHIMELLLNHEVHNKEDIAWKFVNRVEDSKWRCHYCSGEFFGDLTGVKGHLLGVPNEGISICTRMPEHVRTLMQSLLDEVAEEESREVADEQSREAHGQSSMEPQPLYIPTQAEVAEEESRGANGQSSTEPQSRKMPAQAEAGEHESREANGESSTVPQSRDMPTQVEVAQEESRDANSQSYIEPLQGPLFSPDFFPQSPLEQMVPQPMTGIDIGVNSDQQSQAERQLHPTSTVPLLVQSSHGESSSCSMIPLREAEVESYIHELQDQPQCSIRSQTQMNDQQTPAEASSFHNDQLPAVDNSNCLRECNQHPQLQTSMDIDPSIASQHTSDSHIVEAIIVNRQVREAAMNTTGPSSLQASVPPQHRSVPHQPIIFKTAHPNPTMPSSWENRLVTCHPQALRDIDPCIPSSSQAPNNATPPPQILPCGIGQTGPLSLPELNMNKDALMMSHPNTCNDFEENRALKRKLGLLCSREERIRFELEFAEQISLKKPRTEVANWLANVEKLRNDISCIEATSEYYLPLHQQVDILTREAEDFRRRGKGLLEVRKTNKVSERKMVGEAFQRNTAKILEYLAGNRVFQLGIYGMGGVGKTTIMKRVHNTLLEKENYGNVLWITVSQGFCAQKLQNDIWEALGLDKLQEKEVSKRAAILSDHLTERGKSTIILDDVWEYFDLEEVGIPVKANGFKLVIISRSSNVCCQMCCQEKIKIEPLSAEEAESLFMEELRSEVAFNSKIEEIAKSIAVKCAGLPLGVITMAASMRGVTNVFEWKDSLERLKESDMEQTGMDKVLKKLELSYNRLGNDQVKQCFLCCALYPEDKLIEKSELIELFIDQGLIGGIGLNTRSKQYDRGFTILTKLGNVCLLEDHGSEMKMHDLIRDMALHIMSATSIVKAGEWLTRIPDEEYWMDALEKVSLIENDIEEFPLNMSPNCPKLSTLLLNDSLLWDAVIPNSFFEKLLGLKVLNLSKCYLEKLPDSISNLVNLRVLLLRGCEELHYIPYLGKLTSLRKLDAGGCCELEVIEGLEKLVKLRYLDLSKTLIQRLLEGTLEHLLNLQFLKVQKVNEGDITKLGALETLECYIENADDFNMCVRLIEQSDNPCHYLLAMGQLISTFTVEVEVSDDARFENFKRHVDILEWGHAIVSLEGKCTGIFILIPRDVKTMRMEKCNGITNLSGLGPLECLEELCISRSENLRVLYGGHDEEVIDTRHSPAPPPTPLLFPNLRVLEIDGCPKLKYLFGYGCKFKLLHLQRIEISECKEMVGITAAVTSPPPPHTPPAFPCLEDISVRRCNKMKSVVETEWMPHFPILRKIKVGDCAMEEIIGGPSSYVPVKEISLEHLCITNCDNMRKLFSHEWLHHLQNLRSILVGKCAGMVELISGAGQGQEGSIMTFVNNTSSFFQPPISLQKLERLMLYFLPQLKSIVPIRCDSLEVFLVRSCPELKGIPLQLPEKEKGADLG